MLGISLGGCPACSIYGMKFNEALTMDEYPCHIHALANLYELWEFFWPVDVTLAQLREAANDG